MMGTRMFMAARVSYRKHRLLSSTCSHNLLAEITREEDGQEKYANEPKVVNTKSAGDEEYISWERFYQLDKVSR